MNCPKCNASSRVYQSQRPYRHRVCTGPDKHRFKSIEVTLETLQSLRETAAKFGTLRRLISESV